MSKLVMVAASLLLGFELNAATTTVSTGPQLQAAIQNAAAGDTILLNDGTYAVTNAPSSVAFDILQSVTIRSINGASHVTLSGAGWYIAVRIGANNITLTDVTVSGSNGFGVYVTDWTNSHGGVISGTILRNLTVSTAAPPAGSMAQGIAFGATNSVIEMCTISNTDGHGISMSGGSWNLLINNSISNTGPYGIGMPILKSDHNVLVGNTLTNLGADGILLDSSQYNYVAFNTITGPHNGVTLSDEQNPSRHSIRNYVGNNLLTLNNKSGSDGVWVNSDSDWNLVAVNDASGSNENGLALFGSIGNYLRGNLFHQNPQGGIFLLTNGGTVPVNNSIQRNYLGYHGSNAGVITNHVGSTDVGFNFITGNPASINTPIAGFLIEGTADARFYANVVESLNQGENIDANTTNTSLYLNRYFSALNHYTFTGASVQWDSGSTVLGGNFFSDFTSAGANPSNGSSPYTNILDSNSALNNRGVYEDRYPYQAESLGKPYRMAVMTPASGASLAAGSQKTISWNSQGCVLVDINLLDASNHSTSLATNSPDFGYYRWTVPPTAGAHTIQVVCKNSTGATVGVSATGPSFNITTSDLVLLSPQTDLIADPGQSMLISWKKSANVTQPVTINIRYSDANNYTVLQAAGSNDFVTIPVSGTASNRVSVQVVSGSFADSTDGWLTIRNGSGQFTSPASATALYVGTPYPLEWIGPPGSDYVNIDLVFAGGTKNIISGLADFGKYVMLVPDFRGSNGFLRLTFYNSGGTAVGTAQTPTVAVQANACTLSGGGTTTVVDVQEIINQALGVAPPMSSFAQNGVVTASAVQIIINASLGLGCSVL